MLVRLPLSVRTSCTSMPGESSGTRKNVSPRCFGTSVFVRASRNTHSDTSARLVNIFWPLMIQSSPSRTVRVFAAATSEPDSGSE